MSPFSKGMKLDSLKVGVLFLRRKRAGFDPDWGSEMEAAARAQLEKSDLRIFVPDACIVDNLSLRQAVAECREADVDVLVTLQTTMSDGRMAPVLGQIWEDPVILWATPEKQIGSMISACSLVGIHTWAATLRQLGRRFEIVYGMPDTEDTSNQLHHAVRVAYAARRMRQGSVGMVGYHAPGFIDMHMDPFALNRNLGTQFHHISLAEFLNAMDAAEESQVAEDVEKMKALGLPVQDVPESAFPTASRYYLAMLRLMGDLSLDALSVRDWPELSDKVGQWPYLAMTRLSSEGVAVGCEGDADGALSCLLGQLLGGGVSYLSDWLEHDRGTVTLWHAGNAPYQLCEPVGSEKGPRIGRHFNNKNPAVVDADLKAGIPVTLFRLWHCDGQYVMTACDADTLTPRRLLKGSNGLAQLDGRDAHAWFEELCHAGFPHHPAVVAGHHAGLMKRFARQMQIRWVD